METNFKYIVGLTGGMGAGKSTVVAILKNNGIQVFDCDAAVHAIYGHPLFQQEVNATFDLDPMQDTRTQMSAKVLADASVLPRVEQMIEGYLKASLASFQSIWPEKTPIVIDAPLLFEGGWDTLCDFTIGIQCSADIRKARIMQREGMTEAKRDFLMSKQISEEDRAAKIQYTISNDGTLGELQPQVLTLVQKIKDFYK